LGALNLTESKLSPRTMKKLRMIAGLRNRVSPNAKKRRDP